MFQIHSNVSREYGLTSHACHLTKWLSRNVILIFYNLHFPFSIKSNFSLIFVKKIIPVFTVLSQDNIFSRMGYIYIYIYRQLFSWFKAPPDSFLVISFFRNCFTIVFP